MLEFSSSTGQVQEHLLPSEYLMAMTQPETPQIWTMLVEYIHQELTQRLNPVSMANAQGSKCTHALVSSSNTHYSYASPMQIFLASPEDRKHVIMTGH